MLSLHGRARWFGLAASALVACAAVACGANEARVPPPAEQTVGAENTQRMSPTAAQAPDPSMRAILEAHNEKRAEHCAPPLTWSDELERVAQGWADELASRGCRSLSHSASQYGENLAAGTEGSLGPERVVDMWYGEVEGYSFPTGRFSMETGHFTQLVWRQSERLGCATRSCEGITLWVCNYDPPGNVQGQFGDNVLPTSCRR